MVPDEIGDCRHFEPFLGRWRCGPEHGRRHRGEPRRRPVTKTNAACGWKCGNRLRYSNMFWHLAGETACPTSPYEVQTRRAFSHPNVQTPDVGFRAFRADVCRASQPVAMGGNPALTRILFQRRYPTWPAPRKAKRPVELDVQSNHPIAYRDSYDTIRT